MAIRKTQGLFKICGKEPKLVQKRKMRGSVMDIFKFAKQTPK
jgi:hypothetical protein